MVVHQLQIVEKKQVAIEGKTSLKALKDKLYIANKKQMRIFHLNETKSYIVYVFYLRKRLE